MTTRTPPRKPARILRKSEVLERIRVSATTLWRMQGRGEFPPSFRISRGAVGWRESDIERWIEERGRS